MSKALGFALLAGVLALSACAREPEPVPMLVTPTIDKMGNATCPAGYTLAIDGASGAQVCAEPVAMAS
jgi:hypothetical protein